MFWRDDVMKRSLCGVATAATMIAAGGGCHSECDRAIAEFEAARGKPVISQSWVDPFQRMQREHLREIIEACIAANIESEIARANQ